MIGKAHGSNLLPLGSTRAYPARSPEHCKQLVAAGGRGGLGSHPLGANPLALRVPQRGAQGCSRCLHPAGDATSKAHSAPARRNLEHGGEAAPGAVSRETEVGRAASQQLQMAQFTPGQAGQGATAEPLPLLILSLGFFLPFLLSSCSPSPSLWPCWGITNTSHIKAVALGQCHNSFSMQQQTLLCSGASGRAAGGESYTWISSRGTIPPTPKIPLFGAPAHGAPALSNQALRKRTHLLR